MLSFPLILSAQLGCVPIGFETITPNVEDSGLVLDTGNTADTDTDTQDTDKRWSLMDGLELCSRDVPRATCLGQRERATPCCVSAAGQSSALG